MFSLGFRFLYMQELKRAAQSVAQSLQAIERHVDVLVDLFHRRMIGRRQPSFAQVTVESTHIQWG